MDTQSGGGRPQLKKIKRPINRSAPLSSSRPAAADANPFASQSYGRTDTLAASSPGIDIDNYLDEPAVPSKEVREAVTDSAAEAPRYIGEDEYEEEIYGPRASAELPEWMTMKVFFLIVCVCLFVGMVAGKFIFAESKIVRNGLQGVVVNAEVPRGRARCGVAERTQGCVLYIMNPQRQEMRAKDFYDLASQMTGRQRFMIETGNMRYANSKIRPGDIVQLNIPPL